MKVFNLSKGKIKEVDQQVFDKEKEIQTLVEQNTGTLFNLTFIATELTVDKYRIDSLCYDEENNSFVIIEYKKGSSYSVIDQGYTYLQLLLNNKSEFLLTLSQYFDKVMRKEDIDWSQSRIIFVSPSFNAYQKDSVNFKDLPFELWEIRRFENNSIIFNQHRATSKESIDLLSAGRTGSVISEVNKEVKVYTEGEHLDKTTSEIMEKWDYLKEQLEELNDLELVPKRNYISLMMDQHTVCYFNFMKSKIRIDILRGNVNPDGSKSKNYFNLDDPKGISEESSWEWKSGTKGTQYRVYIDKSTDMDYLLFLIKQKYKNMLA